MPPDKIGLTAIAEQNSPKIAKKSLKNREKAAEFEFYLNSALLFWKNALYLRTLIG
ncbi:MAG: hypothetical protein IJD05_01530 [Bacteroidaceae bacterium]|nr:hypothetical protein [Bacteroidaceae bacterium]